MTACAPAPAQALSPWHAYFGHGHQRLFTDPVSRVVVRTDLPAERLPATRAVGVVAGMQETANGVEGRLTMATFNPSAGQRCTSGLLLEHRRTVVRRW